MSLNFLRLGGLTLALAASACTANVSGPDADGTGGTGTQPPGGGSGTGTGTGAVGNGGAPVVDPGNGKIKLDGKPFYSRAIRLTNDQWTNSVKNALALSSPPTQAEGFSGAVKGTTDFMNNEQVLSVDERVWSDYQSAAEALVKQVTADPAALSKIYPGTDAGGFISTVGRRFYRRPLTAAEVTSYQTLFDTGSKSSGTLSTFAKGAGYVLEAMLQSPNFIYRTELGAAGMPLTGFELAAKVSLWLRDSGPDDALLDAAAKGTLDSPDGLATATQTMLEDPSAKTVMRKFHKEFLHFDKFDQLNKEKSEAPDYDPAINPELLEASYLFFEKIFTQNLGVKDIFTTTKGFVGPKMAGFLGVTPGASGLAEQELGPQRAGFFQQLPFLMLYAHNAESDPIHRGVSMSLDVLCAPLGIFAGVIPPLPPRQKGQTNRTRVDAHTSGCGTICHNNMINPLGFAFEHFDGMGRYREMEVHPDETLPIDASGSFDFVEGRKSYKDAAELMQTLATDKQAHLCYSKKLAGYALQRDIVEADGAMLASLAEVSQSANGSVKQVLVNLVKQPAFRTRPGGVQ